MYDLIGSTACGLTCGGSPDQSRLMKTDQLFPHRTTRTTGNLGLLRVDWQVRARDCTTWQPLESDRAARNCSRCWRRRNEWMNKRTLTPLTLTTPGHDLTAGHFDIIQDTCKHVGLAVSRITSCLHCQGSGMHATMEATKTLVHAFVSSRLDYCNSG